MSLQLSKTNKSDTKIEAFGELKESISLNIDHLAQAIEPLTEELIFVKLRCEG